LNILLDECVDRCVDRRLAREIVGHDVTTTQQRGWSGIDNGELLRLAAADFDVFVTVDRNLSFQQPVVQFDIAVVILRAASNRIGDLKSLVPQMLEALPETMPGQVTWIGT
jgi:Domain of unknown function (DUF5615)